MNPPAPDWTLVRAIMERSIRGSLPSPQEHATLVLAFNLHPDHYKALHNLVKNEAHAQLNPLAKP